MKTYMLSLLFAFTVIGCEHFIEPPFDPTDEHPTDQLPGKAADYLPITPGSTWEYFYNGDYAHGYSFETGADSVIDGIVYKTQRDSWNEAVNMYRFSGDDIFRRDWKNNEELVFKMADVGTSWSSTITYDSANFSIVNSSVAAKGLTMRVYGNTFKNVIHIRSLIANYYDGGKFSNEYVYNRYFAKGVGIIKEQMEDGNAGFNGLKKYSIK